MRLRDVMLVEAKSDEDGPYFDVEISTDELHELIMEHVEAKASRGELDEQLNELIGADWKARGSINLRQQIAVIGSPDAKAAVRYRLVEPSNVVPFKRRRIKVTR